MKMRNKTVKGDFSLDPQEVLYEKVQDHGNEFKVLIVSKILQNYVLFESHSIVGHNGTTESYQFLKRPYILLERPQRDSAAVCTTLFKLSKQLIDKF